MKDTDKTKKYLMNELERMRHRSAKLEILEAEHRRAMAALRESEGRYSTLFERTVNPILVSDTLGNYVDCNEAALQFLECTRDELLEKNVTDFVLPGRENKALEDRRLLWDSGGTVETEYYINGKVKVLELAITPVTWQRRRMLLGLGKDITERRQAEVDLKAQKELIDRILATMPNAVLVIGKDSQIVLANQAFYGSFEMENGEVENRSIDELIAAEELSGQISKVLAGKETQLYLEFRHRINGRDRVLVASIIDMGEEEALLILNDVTDEQERQERLFLTDRLASVGEMASGIAHELNNPLTSIISLSRLHTNDDVSPDVREDIEAIHGQAKRSAAIVKNLLTFARKHGPLRQSTQINNVIEDVLKLRAYELSVNNVQVETRFAPELPEIMVDHFQMQQVFLNIILNAECAMIEAHNKGTLTITTERVNSDIKVSFIDDGPGIANEDLSRLFNPFFTTKEVGKGTGLGLSICYGIVAAHDGNIYAQSELGKGAIFVVELPISSDYINTSRMKVG
jgi:PAS domain S-box-containing protein